MNHCLVSSTDDGWFGFIIARRTEASLDRIGVAKPPSHLAGPAVKRRVELAVSVAGARVHLRELLRLLQADDLRVGADLERYS